MREILATIPFLHSTALAVALDLSLGTKTLGVKSAMQGGHVPVTWELDGPLPVMPDDPMPNIIYNPGTCNLLMNDSAQPADDQTALSLIAAHDPVFLSVDKGGIRANGIEVATITVEAPKNGAAAVSLVCTPDIGPAVVEPIVLVNGVGVTQFKTAIAAIYTITVQNAANRSTDSLTIKAA